MLIHTNYAVFVKYHSANMIWLYITMRGATMTDFDIPALRKVIRGSEVGTTTLPNEKLLALLDELELARNGWDHDVTKRLIIEAELEQERMVSKHRHDILVVQGIEVDTLKARIAELEALPVGIGTPCKIWCEKSECKWCSTMVSDD